MSPPPFLQDLVVVASVGVLAALAVRRLRLPAIAGFLVAGAVVGPGGLGLVRDLPTIEILAEVGVVLLLFSVGLEFSLARLGAIARLVAVGGTLQVGLTTGAVVAGALAWGVPIERALVFGFVAALSSTAIVLRGLAERGELDAPHGRLIVGAMIFQDLCVVPMMLAVPLLAGADAGQTGLDAAVTVARAAILVISVGLASRFVVPRLFARVDALRSRETFVLAVLLMCAGTAFLTSAAGLSLALGAFLAGVLLADSDFRHRALTDVLPFRDVFTTLFFISLGMLFDGRVLLDRPVAVALLFAGLFLGKAVIAAVSVLAMRFPLRVAVLVGIGLGQFGEFGFVLAKAAQTVGLLDAEEVRLLLAAGVLTMFVTPVAVRLAPHVAAGAARLRPLERLFGARGIADPAPEDEALHDHVIVVGYGVAGRTLAEALRECAIPCLVVELNAEIVRAARAQGESIYYGDIATVEALAHARLRNARAMVLLINDPDAARRAIAAARRYAPDTPILVRTRYVADRPALLDLGATDVVCEELEGGIEMLARLLRRIGVPRNILADRVRAARERTQHSAREATFPRRRLGSVGELADLKVESWLVRPGAHAAGRSVAELGLRTATGALLVAVQRDGRLTERIDPHDPFRENDVLFLIGDGRSLHRAMALLQEGPPALAGPSEVAL